MTEEKKMSAKEILETFKKVNEGNRAMMDGLLVCQLSNLLKQVSISTLFQLAKEKEHRDQIVQLDMKLSRYSCVLFEMFAEHSNLDEKQIGEILSCFKNTKEYVFEELVNEQ